MFFSHDPEIEKLENFQSYLLSIVEGRESFKDLVDGVLTESKKLAQGDTDHYQIDRDNFFVITFLAGKLAAFLKELNTEALANTDYEKVLTKLKEVA